MAVETLVSHISKLLLENNRIKAYEFELKPGEKTEIHEHSWDFLVYPLSSGMLKLTTRDGQSQESEIKLGEMDCRPAGWHQVENIGNTEVRGLIIELKE